MHPRLVEIVEKLEASRAAVLATVDAINEERLMDAPDGRWSVAQVIDHLAIVETGIARLMAKLLDRAGETLPAESSEQSVLGRIDEQNLSDRTRRIEAPDGVRPREHVTLAEARAALEESRKLLMQQIERADGRALGTLSFPHRIFGPLDLYQWLLFVAHHEDRHREQIEEMVS